VLTKSPNLHGITGQVKAKVSPIKHPVFTKPREKSEDFEAACPDRGDASKKRTRAEPPEPAEATEAAKKPFTCQPILKVHADADRIARVNALVDENKSTAGFFIEAFTEPPETERWFMEVTHSKIINGKVRGIWCKANSLTPESKKVQDVLLEHVKDYGERSIFTPI
jgi:hypothetical protein